LIEHSANTNGAFRGIQPGLQHHHPAGANRWDPRPTQILG